MSATLFLTPPPLMLRAALLCASSLKPLSSSPARLLSRLPRLPRSPCPLHRAAQSPAATQRKGSTHSKQQPAPLRSRASAMAEAPGPIALDMLAKLRAALAPVHMELENESHKHSAPPGSESHFTLFVVSSAFEGKALLERHRMVNELLKEGTNNLPVHALSISAKTPAQWAGGSGAAMQSTPACGGGDGSGSK